MAGHAAFAPAMAAAGSAGSIVAIGSVSSRLADMTMGLYARRRRRSTWWSR